MPEEMDVQIVKAARGVLARHKVDTQKLKFRSISGGLHLRGIFMPLGMEEVPSDPQGYAKFVKLMRVVDGELRGVQRVKSLNVDFDGWEKVGMEWKRTKE
ncbi:hypothetical protein ACFL59_13885 [Planctomycetota bacterium]